MNLKLLHSSNENAIVAYINILSTDNEILNYCIKTYPDIKYDSILYKDNDDISIFLDDHKKQGIYLMQCEEKAYILNVVELTGWLYSSYREIKIIDTLKIINLKEDNYYSLDQYLVLNNNIKITNNIQFKSYIDECYKNPKKYIDIIKNNFTEFNRILAICIIESGIYNEDIIKKYSLQKISEIFKIENIINNSSTVYDILFVLNSLIKEIEKCKYMYKGFLISLLFKYNNKYFDRITNIDLKLNNFSILFIDIPKINKHQKMIALKYDDLYKNGYENKIYNISQYLDEFKQKNLTINNIKYYYDDIIFESTEMKSFHIYLKSL